MPPVQTLIGLVGIAKQTGKGAAAASPAYGLGLTDGKVFNVEIDQEPSRLTLGGNPNDRIAPHAVRTGAHPGMAFTTRAWPRSIPLLWYAALGTLATTGVGPYTHTASPGIDLPYLTGFGRLGPSEYMKLPDCKVNELTMSWDERNPLEVEADLLGLVPALGTAPWVPTNDETSQSFYGPQAGTFQLDVASAVPATAKVTKASLHVNNNLAEVPLSKSILPDDLLPAAQEIDGTITLMPDDLTDWRKAVTGAAGGVAVSEAVIYGSFSLKVVLDANTDLTLAGIRVPMMTELPDANAEGGPAEVELAFSIIRPTGGENAFTAAGRNAVAAY
ncbi:MAG: phage tail tube protein [Actinomycetota bacterium]